MLYNLALRYDAYHVPSATWHTYCTPWNVRAVSRKHALDKGLRVIETWPGFQDRAALPEWRVTAEARHTDGPERLFWIRSVTPYTEDTPCI